MTSIIKSFFGGEDDTPVEEEVVGAVTDTVEDEPSEPADAAAAAEAVADESSSSSSESDAEEEDAAVIEPEVAAAAVSDAGAASSGDDDSDSDTEMKDAEPAAAEAAAAAAFESASSGDDDSDSDTEMKDAEPAAAEAAAAAASKSASGDDSRLDDVQLNQVTEWLADGRWVGDIAKDLRAQGFTLCAKDVTQQHNAYIKAQRKKANKADTEPEKKKKRPPQKKRAKRSAESEGEGEPAAAAASDDDSQLDGDYQLSEKQLNQVTEWGADGRSFVDIARALRQQGIPLRANDVMEQHNAHIEAQRKKTNKADTEPAKKKKRPPQKRVKRPAESEGECEPAAAVVAPPAKRAKKEKPVMHDSDAYGSDGEDYEPSVSDVEGDSSSDESDCDHAKYKDDLFADTALLSGPAAVSLTAFTRAKGSVPQTHTQIDLSVMREPGTLNDLHSQGATQGIMRLYPALSHIGRMRIDIKDSGLAQLKKRVVVSRPDVGLVGKRLREAGMLQLESLGDAARDRMRIAYGVLLRVFMRSALEVQRGVSKDTEDDTLRLNQDVCLGAIEAMRNPVQLKQLTKMLSQQ